MTIAAMSAAYAALADAAGLDTEILGSKSFKIF
jgi:hypothetical protein